MSTMDEAGSSAVALVATRGAGRRRRFSEVLRQIADGSGERLRVHDLLQVFGDRAFGALMLVLAAPNLLPLPPGSSSVLAAPLLFVTAQLMVGRQVLWLPRFVATRAFDRRDFAAIVDRLAPWLARLERLMKPRLEFLLGPVQDRIIGLACLVLALILFLPIPLGNMLPGLAIVCFALGLTERDGLAILLGWLATAASLAVSAVVLRALLFAAHAFLEALLTGG